MVIGVTTVSMTIPMPLLCDFDDLFWAAIARLLLPLLRGLDAGQKQDLAGRR